MSRIGNSVVALLAAILLVQCSDKTVDPPEPDPQPPFAGVSAVDKAVLESSSAFGLNLFKETVAEADEGENVFISPLSISMALGMAYNGAQGETRDSMQAVMGLNGLDPQQVCESYQKLTSSRGRFESDV